MQMSFHLSVLSRRLSRCIFRCAEDCIFGILHMTYCVLKHPKSLSGILYSMIVWIMELAPVCTCTSPLYSVCYPCCLLLTCSPVITFRVLLTVLTAVSSKCTCHPVCKDVLKSQNQKPISSTNQVLIFQRYSHFIVKFSCAAVKGQKQNDLM